MSYLPSHSRSSNERSERRQNHKDEIRRVSDSRKTALDVQAAHRKFDKLAAGFIAAEKVAFVDGQFRVYVGTGKSFYPVYKIGGAFKCECRDRQRYGFCAHEKAASVYAAKYSAESIANQIEEQKPFTATLRYGTRKGLDFEKSEKFFTQNGACLWLVREAANKFQPEGEVIDVFGARIFEITDEFFELWAEV